MSGFLALYQPRGNPQVEELSPLLQVMAHRGPDGDGRWTEGPVALAHLKMATTAEAVLEELPRADVGQNRVITCDARIDNRAELAGRLGLAEFTAEPDSHLILMAYAKFGESCLEHLLGDFAFVIWDGASRTLFCARDPLGIKPFYYHLANDLFVAASEAAAVVAHPDVSAEINEARIADYLVPMLEGVDHRSTFYHQVLRLPPAHSLVVSAGGARLSRYWFPERLEEIRLASDAEYVDTFADLLQQSVCARMRCQTPVVTSLSGGLDSSLIAAMVRNCGAQAGSPAEVIAALADDPAGCVESRHILSMLDSPGLRGHTFSPGDQRAMAAGLKQVFNRLPEPFDASMTLMINVFLRAASRGHRVVLDGVEGDLVHSLPNSYVGDVLLGGSPCRAVQELKGLRDHDFQQGATWFQSVRECLLPSFIPGHLRRVRRSVFSSGWTRRQLRDSPINGHFAEVTGLYERLLSFHRKSPTRADDRLRTLQLNGMTHPLLAVGLERYDRVAALCGVEPRHPLLDRRLVEFSIALPWDQKVRQGWSKYHMRRLAERLLPGEIAWRRGKEHLGWAFSEQLGRDWSDDIGRRLGADAQFLRKIIEPDSAGALGAPGENSAMAVDPELRWGLYHLLEWRARHIAANGGQ